MEQQPLRQYVPLPNNTLGSCSTDNQGIQWAIQLLTSSGRKDTPEGSLPIGHPEHVAMIIPLQGPGPISKVGKGSSKVRLKAPV